MRGDFWSKERLQRWLELFHLNKSHRQIVEAMGGEITRNASIGKAHRMGLPPRNAAAFHGANHGKSRANKTKVAKQSKLGLPPLRGRAAPGRTSVPPLTDAPVPRYLTILELEDGLCRYPIGEPEDRDFAYCGLPANKVYCPYHWHLCNNGV